MTEDVAPNPARGVGVFLLCASLTLVAAEPLRAQGIEWRITPHAGFYLPLGKLVDEESSGERDLEMWHVGSVVAGVHVSAVRGEWEVTAGATYTPSLVAVRTLEATRDVPSNLVTTDVRLLWRPVEATAPREWGLYVGPGLIVVNRWGAAWRGVEETRDVGGLFAVGTRWRLPELAPSAFRVGMTGRLYPVNFRERERVELGEGLQADLVLSAGFSFSMD